jgi:hypothetical protein
VIRTFVLLFVIALALLGMLGPVIAGAWLAVRLNNRSGRARD